VRGNNDTGSWAQPLPEDATLECGGIRIHIVHDLACLHIDAAAAGVRVVVTGHSHKPIIARRDAVLYVNPGSAGPRRFKLPVSAAELSITGCEVEARLAALG
jgi:putative phosphoesterase